MKTLSSLIITCLFVIAEQNGICQKPGKPGIMVNQIGYSAGFTKLAVISDKADSFDILTPTGEVVYKGKPSVPAFWPFAQEWFQQADFSAVSNPGQYYISIPGDNIKVSVEIIPDPFDTLAFASMKAYYYNRCSSAILEKFGGKWHRDAGHPDTAVYVHSSAASENRPEGFKISSPRGWYDAGDYNKYIVNSAITVYTLLLAYETFPQYWQMKNLNIPESGNKIPDILDETLYNLRWMLTMQDVDGGVYHKLTNKNFDGFIQPSAAIEKRYVVQKTTAATLDFAALMAHASQLFSQFGDVLPGLADSCRNAAILAWKWSEKNPDIRYRQPGDIQTGTYEDEQLGDEWFWAAVEMSFIHEANYPTAQLDTFHVNTPWWRDVATLGVISSICQNSNIDLKVKNECRDKLLKYADELVHKSQSSAFPISLDYFVWGSNGDVANQGLIKILAFNLTSDNKYLSSATNDADYLSGMNPTGYCFITGLGVKSPMHIHHRPSASDTIIAPVPGWLAGGPNAVVLNDCPGTPRTNIPALSYNDSQCSYSTNEIAINWNAPLVFLAGGLAAIASHK